ncbi:MAG: glycosyltransferase family 4 protein [Candidatus Sabulitectum sp.]|nr:glycosyltransferase family 4 protein [Candidatus Sabulitectum sp.]
MANQTGLLATTLLFQKMSFTIVRSNPERVVEKPGALSRFFSAWPVRMHQIVSSAVKENSPDIVFVRANGDISFLRNVFLGYVAAKKSKAPLVIHMHASRRGFWHDRKAGSTDKSGFVKRCFDSLGYKLVSMLLKKASAFSQLTVEIDQYYQSVGLRPATHVIPNAVLLRNPDLSSRESNQFLFVGRLSREKGFFDLLEALAILENSDWVLDVLGSPVSNEDNDLIQSILKNHPHRKQIRLHGTIKGDAKWEYFDASSFLILPTHLEVFPNVILEAMASGLAVISTPIGEIESMLPEGGGALVPPGDVEALSKSISSLLKDPEEVNAMGVRNREKVTEYSLESVASMFEDMLLGSLPDSVRDQ